MNSEIKLKILDIAIIFSIVLIVSVLLLMVFMNVTYVIYLPITTRNFIILLNFIITLFLIGITIFCIIYRFYFFPFFTEEGLTYVENDELDESRKIESLAYQIKEEIPFTPWNSKMKLKDQYSTSLILIGSIASFTLGSLFFINLRIIIYLLSMVLVLYASGAFLLFLSILKYLPKLQISSSKMKFRRHLFKISYEEVDWNSLKKCEIKKRTNKFRKSHDETLIAKIYFEPNKLLELNDNDFKGFQGFINFIKTLKTL